MPLGVQWAVLEFAQPWWLLGLLVLVPVVWLWKTSKVPASKFRRWASLVLRCGLMAALVLALAGVRVIWNNKGVCVVFVIDQSQSVLPSVREAMRGAVEKELEKMGRDDQFVMVAFGGDAVLESLPSQKGKMPPPAMVRDTGRTDIARALRLAMASFPPGMQKRIVLLSDGNQNVGDAVREARIASVNDVDIDVMMLGSPVRHEVVMEQLVLPTRVQKNANFNARVVISADQAQGAELVIIKDGQTLAPKQVQLRTGINVFDLPSSLDSGGFHEYQVTVVPRGGPDADGWKANNTAYGFTQVDAPGKVLVVRGKGSERDYISQALKENRIETVEGTAGTLAPEIKGLLPYDCVVLENVNRWQLSQAQLDNLEKWVKDFGGGVVMIGGDESFGPGGYKGTPLEAISPVEMDVKRKKHLASVAMVIVLDKSGSMGAPAGGGAGLMKMDLANQGAIEAVKLLSAADEAQIGAVDTEVKWMTANKVVPMDEGHKRVMIGNTKSNMPGGGGIYCKTALAHAYRLVTAPNVNAMVRHVILFADLCDSEQQEDCEELARKYFKMQPSVTLTVIGMGRPTDPDAEFQKRVAKAGGGRWYYSEDVMQLPRIFVKEAFIASRSAFVEKKEGIPPTLYGDSPLWQGIGGQDGAGVPRVYGYVGTTLKPRATLAAHGQEADDPLLAHWSIGLGKVVAYTSDATNRWGKDWVAWEGFNKFWAQTVRWASKSVQNSQVTTVTSIEGSQGRVVVEAVDSAGKPINNLQLKANVAPPDQSDLQMSSPLIQVAPGRYEGKFPVGRSGTYMTSVIDTKSGSPVDYSGAVMSYPPEYRDLTPNAGLLRTLAETSGGQELKSLDEVFKAKEKTVQTYWPLWGPLLVLAVVGLLVDVTWRRLNVADWFRKGKPRLEHVPGSGATLGAFRSIKSGRREVAQQTQTLRERVEVAVSAPKPAERVSESEPLPVEQPRVSAGPAGKEEKTPEGYSNRLMGAKRRAAEQIRDQAKGE